MYLRKKQHQQTNFYFSNVFLKYFLSYPFIFLPIIINYYQFFKLFTQTHLVHDSNKRRAPTIFYWP